MASTPGSTFKSGSSERDDMDNITNKALAVGNDLASAAGKVADAASEKFAAGTEQAKKLAADAGEKASEFRDLVETRVKDHPLTSVGIALALGYVFAAISRRS